MKQGERGGGKHDRQKKRQLQKALRLNQWQRAKKSGAAGATRQMWHAGECCIPKLHLAANTEAERGTAGCASQQDLWLL